MRTPWVVMHDPLVQDILQVLDCQRNEKIHALTSQRAQEPLAEGIRQYASAIQHSVEQARALCHGQRVPRQEGCDP